ncbi:hypothetical protein Ocin01_17978 [Orchesella cincta]|uniref:Uncharacterized protein n=1 Tax=Orchesella cincta TaxID=48709 RepID=A0A1D2M6W1_ORCCI|nr:hypothetical protein Ocin01_17978 [Orchesella cincta]
MLDLLMTRVNGYDQLMKSLKDAKQNGALNYLNAKLNVGPNRHASNRSTTNVPANVPSSSTSTLKTVKRPDAAYYLADDHYRLPTDFQGTCPYNKRYQVQQKSKRFCKTRYEEFNFLIFGN